MTPPTIPLGFEVGTGARVSVPLAHTFVTGQTQLSGKTTTLRALVGRSGRRALAFVTKRGEHFLGRRIRPYLPREGEHPIHWRLVETILASALGQRSLKYERVWIVNAAKGARSLADVRANVDRLKARAKGSTADVYMLIGEYLDLVLPEMRALAAADTLDLAPGLNVMDLAGVGHQLQALVIRAALERINHHEQGVLTVFPEAWEFAPRGRSAPAKDEAVAMARKGAVLGNYLLCDSQDIAGVDTVLRQAASVWILGVQRELNELKRTIDSIPAGIAKPKPGDVATLGVGQFYACWGRHCVKTYVQPSWMEDVQAEAIARGDEWAAAQAQVVLPETVDPARVRRIPDPPHPDEDDDMGQADQVLTQIADSQARVELLIRQLAARPAGLIPAADPLPAADPPAAAGAADFEALYAAIKARLMRESPALLVEVLAERPEIRVTIERPVIQADGTSAYGLLALLIREGFFDETVSATAAWKEMQRRGFAGISARVYEQLPKLTTQGFLTKEGKDGYRAAKDMKANIKTE